MGDIGNYSKCKDTSQYKVLVFCKSNYFVFTKDKAGFFSFVISHLVVVEDLQIAKE